ncbi:MAG: sigma-70 family RNA polymerase sigma factor [Planctomycetes bacterium]|nr:sigma-70 family RNA polymerase sigma factor [Planctomycetota bacterium]
MSDVPEDLSLTTRQVRAAQGGDRGALDELLRRYLPRVRRIVACRMGKVRRDMVDLDDLVQETFADVVAGFDRFEQRTEGAFLNWIASCILNNIRDQARRGKALKRGEGRVHAFADLGDTYLTDSIFAGKEASPSENIRTHETEEHLERALLSLSERYREAINLRVFCQMSYREIAEIMGLPSENTANVLFLRARDKLQKILST